MNRVAGTSSIARPAIYEPSYLQRLQAALRLPLYVWVGMVLLSASAVCYSVKQHTLIELRIAGTEHREIVERINRLEIENIRLSREMDAVEKDPRTIESLARKAGMVAEGESVVLIEKLPNGSEAPQFQIKPAKMTPKD